MQNQTYFFGAAGALVLALFLFYSGTFIVTPREQALVVQLGNPVREVTAPGLYFKIPLFESVILFEKRVMELQGASGEVITQDRKRIEVEAFARYRITNVQTFYRQFRDQRNGSSQLTTKLSSQLKNAIGTSTFIALLSADRLKVMDDIRKSLLTETKNLGVEIVDVRIRRADLPQQNQEAVFAQMRTDREKEAALVRAKGKELAQTLRAKADREVVTIKAEATRKSEILRGDGDAARNRILGEAYSRDADFFSFFRSLKAYETSLTGSNTTMLLSPDSPFFRYFGRPPTESGR